MDAVYPPLPTPKDAARATAPSVPRQLREYTRWAKGQPRITMPIDEPPPRVHLRGGEAQLLGALRPDPGDARRMDILRAVVESREHQAPAEHPLCAGDDRGLGALAQLRARRAGLAAALQACDDESASYRERNGGGGDFCAGIAAARARIAAVK